MAIQKLEKLSNKSNFAELSTFPHNYFSKDNQRRNVSLFLRSFRMTQSFLDIIYDRILEDIELDQKYWSIQAEIDYFENEEYELTEEEKILFIPVYQGVLKNN